MEKRVSRDKQIAEMARIAYEMETFDESDAKIVVNEGLLDSLLNLYDAGYRKASDVVRDIFNDLNEMWHKGRGFINYSDLVRLERLHEQKYMEDGK